MSNILTVRYVCIQFVNLLFVVWSWVSGVDFRDQEVSGGKRVGREKSRSERIEKIIGVRRF